MGGQGGRSPQEVLLGQGDLGGLEGEMRTAGHRSNRPAVANAVSQEALSSGDPALQMSELYAARSRGRQPGTLTQQEREAQVRAFIPGGDKELPSEIRRTSAEPDSAQRLPASATAAETL